MSKNTNEIQTLNEEQAAWLDARGYSVEIARHGGIILSKPGRANGDLDARWRLFEEVRGEGYVISLVSKFGAYRPRGPGRMTLRTALLDVEFLSGAMSWEQVRHLGR